MSLFGSIQVGVGGLSGALGPYGAYADAYGAGPPSPGIFPPLPDPVADPRTQYVVAGYRAYSPDFWETLLHPIDEITAIEGFRAYETMLGDPKVRASIDTLKQGALSDKFTLMPAVSKEPASDGEEPIQPGDPELAMEILDFCRRSLDRLERPIEEVAHEMLDACCFGSMLAEQTYEYAETGIDKGKLVLKSLRVKPPGSWSYVVNRHVDIMGILAYVPIERELIYPPGYVPDRFAGKYADAGAGMTLPGTAILPRSKFAILQWNPRREDPRGQSILRAAYHAWNMKQQLLPEFFKYVTQFAVPSLIGKVAGDGQPVNVNGKNVSPRDAMLGQLQSFRNAMAIVIGSEDDILPLEIRGEGEAFLKAFDWLDRQIVVAILQQTRATEEAVHSSKADSESGQDILGLPVRYAHRKICACFRRDVLRQLVLPNYGLDAADRLTPKISAFGVEHHDQAALMGGVSNLHAGGYFQEDQYPGLDTMLGIQVRKPGGGPARIIAQELRRQASQQKASDATVGSQQGKSGVKGVGA